MINLFVRNYRGVERADIAMAPIALVAGKNEQGKSSIAEAARAVLSGTPIPIPGIAKKNAKLLLRSGSTEAWAKATNDKGVAMVTWPKAEASGGPWAGPFAVGLQEFTALDPAKRATTLSAFIDSQPTLEDVSAEMRDAGYNEEAISKVWHAITTTENSWDGMFQKSRDYSATLKGKWEGIAGEKYGSKKAEDWTPAAYPGDDAGGKSRFDPEGEMEPRERLEAAVNGLRSDLEYLIGQQAVGARDTDSLREQAGKLEEYVKARTDIQTALVEADNEFQRNLDNAPPQIPDKPLVCPNCDASLLLNDWTLMAAEKQPTDEELAKAQQAIEEHKKQMALAQQGLQEVRRGLAVATERENAARQAKEKLEAMEGDERDDSDVVTTEQVQAQRNDLAKAENELAAYDAKINAGKAHAAIQRNDKLIQMLAPDGLRRRKLADGLKDFNAEMATMCSKAKWPAVRIDEDLQVHYGDRPFWAASASGKWRARTVLQVILAICEDSHAIILDEVDILDAAGRNGLIKMLQELVATKEPHMAILLCMTANKPELVPDLKKAALGASYWIDKGVCKPLSGVE